MREKASCEKKEKTREALSPGSSYVCTADSLKDVNVLYNVGLQNRQHFFCAVLGVDIQIDGLGEIQAEDTHDGLCVDHISAGNQVKVTIKFGNIVYKGFHFVD